MENKNIIDSNFIKEIKELSEKLNRSNKITCHNLMYYPQYNPQSSMPSFSVVSINGVDFYSNNTFAVLSKYGSAMAERFNGKDVNRSTIETSVVFTEDQSTEFKVDKRLNLTRIYSNDKEQYINSDFINYFESIGGVKFSLGFNGFGVLSFDKNNNLIGLVLNNKKLKNEFDKDINIAWLKLNEKTVNDFLEDKLISNIIKEERENIFNLISKNFLENKDIITSNLQMSKDILGYSCLCYKTMDNKDILFFNSMFSKNGYFQYTQKDNPLGEFGCHVTKEISEKLILAIMKEVSKKGELAIINDYVNDNECPYNLEISLTHELKQSQNQSSLIKTVSKIFSLKDTPISSNPNEKLSDLFTDNNMLGEELRKAIRSLARSFLSNKKELSEEEYAIFNNALLYCSNLTSVNIHTIEVINYKFRNIVPKYDSFILEDSSVDEMKIRRFNKYGFKVKLENNTVIISDNEDTTIDSSPIKIKEDEFFTAEHDKSNGDNLTDIKCDNILGNNELDKDALKKTIKRIELLHWNVIQIKKYENAITALIKNKFGIEKEVGLLCVDNTNSEEIMDYSFSLGVYFKATILDIEKKIN